MRKKIQQSSAKIQGMSGYARAAVSLLVLMTVLLGMVYPLLVTGIAGMVFPHKAGGSLMEKNGKIIGSEWLGQSFTQPKYFWGRLSATTPPYNAAASSGSNFSPANPKLLDAANDRIRALKKYDPANKAPIPVDLVTASASGLDPDISVAAAEYQVARVAKTRDMKEEDVKALIKQYRRKRTLGFIGEARVNVLLLNLALDEGSGVGGQGSGKKK